ncbi:hypothetical protein B0J14DRAFT_170102 [Halenospora varia]|nr:hypothetical protein B0J14DRAFT_170102 [Halenospora varia]
MAGSDTSLARATPQKTELGFQDSSDEYLATNFRALADECYMIAKRFFRTQLPQEFLSSDFWEELENSGFIKAGPKKLPLSNSIPAQCLRMATAERIIADKLCIHIFRKYYLPESSPARAVLNDVLTRLGKSNSNKGAIFRLQLLAAYEPDEHGYVSSLVKSTIEEVVTVLDPLLFAPSAREGFQSALRKLLDEAVKLWRSVQRSAAKGSVLNDPEHRGFSSVQNQDWDMNEEYDNAVELAADQMMYVPDQSEPVISLFPQLSVGGNVICRGCALWSDQNTVVAATIEFGQLNSRNPAQGRGALGRRDSDRRKLSFSGSSSLGRRGEDPSTSPRSPPGNPSFLEHANSYTNSWKMPLPAARSGELSGNVGVSSKTPRARLGVYQRGRGPTPCPSLWRRELKDRVKATTLKRTLNLLQPSTRNRYRPSHSHPHALLVVPLSRPRLRLFGWTNKAELPAVD